MHKQSKNTVKAAAAAAAGPKAALLPVVTTEVVVQVNLQYRGSSSNGSS